MNYLINSKNKIDLVGVITLLAWHDFPFVYSPTKGISYVDVHGKILRDIQNTMNTADLVVTISRI